MTTQSSYPIYDLVPDLITIGMVLQLLRGKWIWQISTKAAYVQFPLGQKHKFTFPSTCPISKHTDKVSCHYHVIIVDKEDRGIILYLQMNISIF